MKILENLLSDNQENEIESPNLVQLPGRPSTLSIFNLESRHRTTHMLFVDIGELGEAICLCPLPENKLFCCGYVERGGVRSIFFIIDEKYDIKILPSDPMHTGRSAAYYNNSVYVCGHEAINRFDLVNWRWEKLVNLITWYRENICIEFNGMILVLVEKIQAIFVLDLLILSLSSNQLVIEPGGVKFLCKWENSAYLLNFPGKILKSETGNPFNWINLGNFNPSCWVANGYRVFYKNSLYFFGGKFILKFDMKKRKFLEIGLPKSKGRKV